MGCAWAQTGAAPHGGTGLLRFPAGNGDGVGNSNYEGVARTWLLLLHDHNLRDAPSARDLRIDTPLPATSKYQVKEHKGE
jgi:hypothetical protein